LFENIREGIVQSRLNERLWRLVKKLLRIQDVPFNGLDEIELLQRILNDEKSYEIINRLPQNDLDRKKTIEPKTEILKY